MQLIPFESFLNTHTFSCNLIVKFSSVPAQAFVSPLGHVQRCVNSYLCKGKDSRISHFRSNHKPTHSCHVSLPEDEQTCLIWHVQRPMIHQLLKTTMQFPETTKKHRTKKDALAQTLRSQLLKRFGNLAFSLLWLFHEETVSNLLVQKTDTSTKQVL